MARRKGNDWYIGTISNGTNHNIKPTMSFLPAGDYMAEIYREGPDADKQPDQLVKIKQKGNRHRWRAGNAFVQDTEIKANIPKNQK